MSTSEPFVGEQMTPRSTVKGGSSTVSWDGTGNFSSIRNISHGLGVTPSSVSISIQGIGVNFPVFCFLANAPSPTLVQFQAYSTAVPPNGTSATIYWAVIP